MQMLIHAAKSFKASIEVVRERNKKFNKANKTTDDTDKDNPNVPGPSKDILPDKKIKLDKDQERQTRIKQEIIKGIFNLRSHFNSVKPNCCIWHNTESQTHVQRNEIGRLLQQHPHQKYYF